MEKLILPSVANLKNLIKGVKALDQELARALIALRHDRNNFVKINKFLQKAFMLQKDNIKKTPLFTEVERRRIITYICDMTGVVRKADTEEAGRYVVAKKQHYLPREGEIVPFSLFVKEKKESEKVKKVDFFKSLDKFLAKFTDTDQLTAVEHATLLKLKNIAEANSKLNNLGEIPS